MKPAWSVIFFSTLAGAGQGLFLALAGADLFLDTNKTVLCIGATLVLALLGGGLIASFFHLGRPERAWRAVAMWRTSWLSREVIVLPALMAIVAAWGAAQWLGKPALGWALAGVLLTAALFLCTAMIYACLKFLQEWHTPLTVVNYTLLGCASGLTLATALASWLDRPLVRPFAVGALVVGLLAYAARLASLARNAGLRPKSTLGSAIGIPAAKIRQISQGAMGGSYNTREFFHHRPALVVRLVRWTLLALVYPLPAALILVYSRSSAMLLLAFVLQYLGLVAERWYFFAEARHPQNLYYQAIA
jgi:DMSO reductase anchor subunit